MLKISEIIGFPIICLDTQKKVGEIRDALLNLNNNKIIGFVIDCGSLMHRAKFVDYNTIYSIGNNLITIKSKKVLSLNKSINLKKDDYYLSKSIEGMEVITENGDILGFIHDIFFEKIEGNLLGLMLTNGILDDILSGVQILPMDKSFIYSKEKLIIEDKIKNIIVDNIGGLKKLLELER